MEQGAKTDWTESEVIRLLKGMARGREEYRRKKRALLSIQEAQAALTPVPSDAAVQKDLEVLAREETASLYLERMLWQLEPSLRDLLMGFYVEHRSAKELAVNYAISDATFWRRRRKALAVLMHLARSEEL